MGKADAVRPVAPTAAYAGAETEGASRGSDTVTVVSELAVHPSFDTRRESWCSPEGKPPGNSASEALLTGDPSSDHA